MRSLLAAAAVILSVAAAHAEDSARRSVHPQPAVDPATQSIIDKLKGKGEAKRDVKPVDAAPVQAAPAEAKPSDARAVEAKPVEAKPAEAKAVDTKPVEAKPVQAATDAKPEKKRVAAKASETREQTARRIAERYGFHLEME